MTLRRALALMLRGTKLTFREVDSETFRIIRLQPNSRSGGNREKSNVRPPSTARPAIPKPVIYPPIIVTATKLDTRLDEYAGTAHVINIDNQSVGIASQGLGQLTDGIPTIAQTELGPGRNKLFVRGLADSSINGPTQSTLAFYLNDTRLTYASPNPDLPLYDVERVEIIEGPQGSLYGAGSIGGIVRTVTKPAELNSTRGTIWASGALTKSGKPSADVAAVVNVPLSERSAIRLLGYYGTEGGYIDDSLRRLADINDSRRYGWRLSASFEPGDDWKIDLLATNQTLRMDDGQYAETGLAPLTRASAIAQPFEIDFSAFSGTIKKRFANIDLLSATGFVSNDVDTVFDATDIGANGRPQLFDEEQTIRLFSHETRLSQKMDRWSWLAGVSHLRHRNRLTQSFGPVDAPLVTSSVVYRVQESAGFGEFSLRATDRIKAIVGGRLTFVSSETREMMIPGLEFDPSNNDVRFLPTAAISWIPNPSSSVHLRYQKGFRVGGISISGGNTPMADRFVPDTVDTGELGIRYALGPSDNLKIEHSFFYTRWRDVQADLIDANGFPRIANLGDGHVYGATSSISWKPVPDLLFQLSGFINESEVTEFAPDFDAGDESRLPNIAELGATGRFSWSHELSKDLDLNLRYDFQYVGSNILGNDSFLEFDQGDYVQLNGGVSLSAEDWTVDFSLTNILNGQANRFSIGNPFSVTNGLQITPLRPVTGRLSFRLTY